MGGDTFSKYSWVRCPIEFTDSGIIFYDHKKDNSFKIEYGDIAYVNPDLYRWGLDIQLKTDILLKMDSSTAENIKKGYPFRNWFPVSGLTPSLQQFALNSNISDKEKIIRSFKNHGVKVLDPHNREDFNKSIYPYGLGYLKEHAEWRIFYIIFLIFCIIFVTSGIFLEWWMFTGKKIFNVFNILIPQNMRFFLVVSMIFLVLIDFVCIWAFYHVIKNK